MVRWMKHLLSLLRQCLIKNRKCFRRRWYPSLITIASLLITYILLQSLDWTSYETVDRLGSQLYQQAKAFRDIFRILPRSVKDDLEQDYPDQPLSTRRSNMSCVIPVLDPYDPQIIQFDLNVSKVTCDKTPPNWVYVDNGTFRLSEYAKTNHTGVVCKYTPIVRGFGYMGDFPALGTPVIPMHDESPLLSDFFKVNCENASSHKYSNIHLGVAYNEHLHQRSRVTPLPKTAMGGYDVLMLGFDSVSRMSWIRNLPRTREYFLNVLKGEELEHHAILGDGTVAGLMPLLSGLIENDARNTRKDSPARVARTVDYFPWIWDFFKKAGYITAWGEDQHTMGTFQYRLKGFRDQPTDHDLRPYFQSVEPSYSNFQPGCIGSEVRHVRFFNFFHDLYRMYGDKRKFMFGFHSELSHDSTNGLKQVDEDFADFLDELYQRGYLDHTILILMSDHGSRFGVLRATQQGKLEERLPYFSFRFPQSFQAAYPEQVANFRKNRFRLNTNFDVYETFHDLLDFRPRSRLSMTKGRGISLFAEIPENRTCEDASVEPHWCPCLTWGDASHDSGLTKMVGYAVVDYFNSLLAPVRHWCATLSLKQVLSLSRFVPTNGVLKFKKSLGKHADDLDMSDNMTLTFDYLQVTLVTTPGLGRFEATVRHNVVNNNISIRAEDVSRTNRYGTAPACIMSRFPYLRPYCYCL